MPATAPQQTHTWYPTRFVDRGVVAPFTSALLGAARLRAAVRNGPEVVVPTQSGGRGLYVLDWSAVCETYRPTVHDHLLHRRLSGAAVITPGLMRDRAREVAIEGLAGRSARLAARAAAHAAKTDENRLNFLLLMALVEQIEPSGLRIGEGLVASPGLERHAHDIIARFATGSGQPGETIRIALAAIARAAAAVGMGAERRRSRVDATLRRIRAMCEAIVNLTSQSDHDHQIEVARRFVAQAVIFAKGGETLLRESWSMMEDMPTLLRRWHSHAAETEQALARPEWFLDGWDPICAVWEASLNPCARQSSLYEMSRFVPYLPDEAMDWLPTLDLQCVRQIVPPVVEGGWQGGWQGGGALFARVARNEQILAATI